MTTKKYLGLEDILAIRIECRNCHVALTGSPADLLACTAHILNTCPAHCNQTEWAGSVVQQQIGHEVGIRDFLKQIDAIKNDKRYLLTFEVKQEEPAAASK